MISGNPTISETAFDVIIIGAGINGAGIARDAALRGLKVLLLDKADIGGGTSAWSTRLIHGGLRYLEHGELGLVRESLRERECLLNIAPHLVRPLPMLVPLYRGARRGPWTMRAGMIAYDLLSFDKTLPRHRMLSRTEALQEVDGLNPDGLIGAALYYDAQVEFAERLVLENALSAVELGARVETYARVDRFIVEGGNVSAVEFTRELGGARSLNLPQMNTDHSDQKRFDLSYQCLSVADVAHAKLIVNAAGPWVDQVLLAEGSQDPSSQPLIGGTKGSHIIVGPFPGAPSTPIYVEAKTDSRPFFIIPWNRNYLIGTTDIPYDGDLNRVAINDDEIEYLLREMNRVIPSARLGRDAILYTYSGVRPLPFTGEKDARSITRRHFIRRHPALENLVSIVGGKLTTYRSLAEETVDLIFKKLGRDAPKCTTAEVALPGAHTSEFAARFKAQHQLTAGSAEHLLRTYGAAATKVMEYIDEDSRLAEVIDPETGAIAAEVVYAFKREFAQTLSDCLLRRTMIGLNSTRGLDSIEAVGRVAQNFLGWSDERAALEVASYRSSRIAR